MAIKNINNNMNQGQNQQMNPFGPAPLVQKAAQESFALKNGGEMPPPVMQGSPNGGVAPVAPSPVNYFQNGGGINGKFDLTPDTPAPAPEYGTEGVKVTENPAEVKQNDLSSLSAALSNVGGQQEPQFASDPNQRDGGFFGWLKGLAPKLRPGRREGETDDEYDRRITTNRENMAALADAMRHMGNIINTTKYAPAQQFNDPYSAMEQGYQQRKAQRQKQAALEADQSYKQANLSLKEKAAEADRAYKDLSLGFKQQAEKRAAEKDAFDRDFKTKGFQRQLDNDKFNQELAGEKFKESQRHNKVSEGQGAARIALAQERNSIAKARLAHSISTSGSGGRGGSLTNLSSPYGHLNRKKDLNSIEKKQITQHLIQNGYIDKKNLDTYKMWKDAGNNQSMNDLQNYWIAYAANMPGKKGDAFRKLLKDHYMYGETNTVSPPKTVAKSQPKKAAPSKGKGGNSFKNFKL